MDSLSQPNEGHRITQLSGVSPVRALGEENRKQRKEERFPPGLLSALSKLRQRDDMAGFDFKVHFSDNGSLLVLLLDEKGETVASFSPGECLERAGRTASAGLIVETRC